MAQPLFTDLYCPQTAQEIVGNKSVIASLKSWLESAVTAASTAASACLISGSCGIGKTLAITLLVQQLGLEPIYLNNGDQSCNKEYMEGYVKSVVTNKQSILNGGGSRVDTAAVSQQRSAIASLWAAKSTPSRLPPTTASTSAPGSATPPPPRKVLIVENIETFSDKSFVTNLLNCIKCTAIPILLTCNDRYHLKLKTLLRHVTEFRFAKPNRNDIYRFLLPILAKEEIEMDEKRVYTLIDSTNGDIRSILNTLQFDKAGGSIKDTEAASIFTSASFLLNLTNKFKDKFATYWSDPDMHTLFVHQNYAVNVLKDDEDRVSSVETLTYLSTAAERLSDADVVDAQSFGFGNWELKSYVACNVIGAARNCHIHNLAEFPRYLGAMSTMRKNVQANLDEKYGISKEDRKFTAALAKGGKRGIASATDEDDKLSDIDEPETTEDDEDTEEREIAEIRKRFAASKKKNKSKTKETTTKTKTKQKAALNTPIVAENNPPIQTQPPPQIGHKVRKVEGSEQRKRRIVVKATVLPMDSTEVIAQNVAQEVCHNVVPMPTPVVSTTENDGKSKSESKRIRKPNAVIILDVDEDEKNKDNGDMYHCTCGAIIKKSGKPAHLKTKKHCESIAAMAK